MKVQLSTKCNFSKAVIDLSGYKLCLAIEYSKKYKGFETVLGTFIHSGGQQVRILGAHGFCTSRGSSPCCHGPSFCQTLW